jgi:hypothetical protein
MRITKRQLRRIIREERAKVLTENRLRRRVRQRLTERVENWSVAVQQIADAIKAAEYYPDEVVREHPAGRTLTAPIEQGVEIGPYTESIYNELVKLGVNKDDANSLIDSLYQ